MKSSSRNTLLAAFCVVALGVIVLIGTPAPRAHSVPPNDYIGAQACADCHGVADESGAGFDIFTETSKTGHPLAAHEPAATLPPETSSGPLEPPPDNPDWSQYAYAIGGYAWKTTFVKASGEQLEEGKAQYNHQTGEWTPYHFEGNRGFDFECSRCHTTGATPQGSWNGTAEDSLGTWAELGVQCEACHGPSSRHATDLEFSTPHGENFILLESCGDCHNNGGKRGPMPVINGNLPNHAQYQEFNRSAHGSLGFATCVTCHEPHAAIKYPDALGRTENGSRLNPFRSECQDCHTSTKTQHPPDAATCVDCHMPKANVSAVGQALPNGGFKGDVASHIWKINPDPVPRDSMFTTDGFVRAGRPALTLDYACLACHTDADEDLGWASSYAQGIHQLATSRETDIPKQNRVFVYPSPFSIDTNIEFTADPAKDATVTIRTLTGRTIANLPAPAGNSGRSVNWMPSTHQAAGLYLFEIRTSGERATSGSILFVR